MGLSPLSWHCIVLAIAFLLFNVYSFDEDWKNLEKHVMNKTESEDPIDDESEFDSYVFVGYSLAAMLFAILMIWGIFKRNVYLMVPVFFTIGFGMFYSEDWFKSMDKWMVVLGAAFVLLNPIFIEMHQICKENAAKRRRQVTVYG
ncbi:uncharacterized protein LOC101895311 isoform X1 [Musca domestica]|uniref:Uncharacterized protein LOC101895311 isoform X1 n=1 Tax=Musca domestica TaxID=7370 RepID=A0A1I8M635_MUSDO|nr:uncharacterized protein LOC101895311 isoform X1 [Musca domestica]